MFNLKRLPRLLRFSCLAVFAFGWCILPAKPPFLRVFFDTYHVKDGSKLAATRCLNCHEAPGPPRLNPYGKQVQAALGAAHARMVTPEILKSIEKKNAGDGTAFVDKIEKDRPPGVLGPNPKPKPKAKAKGAGKVRKRASKKRHKKGVRRR